MTLEGKQMFVVRAYEKYRTERENGNIDNITFEEFFKQLTKEWKEAKFKEFLNKGIV